MPIATGIRPDRLAAALQYLQDMGKRKFVFDESGREYTVPANGEAPGWYEKALPMEGRATFLPFQDSAPGSVMNKRELALPGIVAGAVNALTAPGRAISGSDPTFNAPEEAANVAMNVMGGGMGVTAVKPAPAGSLGMFIGKTAKTWNPESHAQALQMEKAGSTPTDIWEQTGNWKGPEGAWRQEISDKESKITDDVFNSIKEKQRFEGPMSQALSHEELYKANPELGNIKSGFFADATPGGSYHAETNSILAGGPSTGQQRSTALHELQHAIQAREGWAKGGTPADEGLVGYARTLAEKVNAEFTPEINRLGALKQWDELAKLDDARRAKVDAIFAADKNGGDFGGLLGYRSLAGEAEARATQARRNMTDEERRAMFPEESYDVPMNELIVRHGGTGPQMSTSWHGSPHTFDKFNSSMIGSSQDGKLFGGHGFSVADNPRDAQLYGKNLYKVDIPDAAIFDARDKTKLADVFSDLIPRGQKKPIRDLMQEYEAAKQANKIEDVYLEDLGNGFKGIQWKTNGDWVSPMNNRVSSLQLSEDPSGMATALRMALPRNPEEFLNPANFNPLDVAATMKNRGYGAATINGSIGHVGNETTVFDPEVIRILERNGVPTGAQPWKPGEYQGKLAELLSNGNKDYSVGQSVGGVHEILQNGEIVGTVAGGKAKDAVKNFFQRQEELAQAASDKKARYAENAIKNTARKNDVLSLNLAMENNADLIKNLHKQQNLEFTPLQEGVFGAKGNPVIHKSPAYGKKPGSAYELVMVNGEPAYARQSDHWGQFSTNDYINGEPVSSNYNWPLKGVETPSYGGKSQAGYILLKDLIK